MNEMAKIELSKDIIEPIVRAQLHASILAALGRSDQLIAGVVQTIMNTQVDSDGKASHYSGRRPLITWMAEKAIKEEALSAIKDWFNDNRESLRREILAALKRNQKSMAEKFVMGMCESATNSYRTTVNIVFGKD